MTVHPTSGSKRLELAGMDIEVTHGVDLGAETLDKQETEGLGDSEAEGFGSVAGPRGAARETDIRDQRHPGARWHPGRAHGYRQAACEHDENVLYQLEHPFAPTFHTKSPQSPSALLDPHKGH